jgi:hypothetical protein
VKREPLEHEGLRATRKLALHLTIANGD